MSILKPFADAIARGAQTLETAARGDDNDVVLDGFGRVEKAPNRSYPFLSVAVGVSIADRIFADALALWRS